MSDKAYSALGGSFEYLNNDCGYEQWSQYLIEKLAGIPQGAKGVDIGCGNGYFTRALTAAGYDMCGMDISPEMLSKAVELARKAGQKTEYLLGDAAALKLNFKADFIISVNDCFNYVPGAKLCHAFKMVHASLKKGGLFIFDISTEEKLRETIGNNLFAEDRGDIAYMWFNTLKEDRVEMDVTVFMRREDGAYIRADERQTQYIHGVTDVISALEGAGFAVKSEYAEEIQGKGRINFICTKL